MRPRCRAWLLLVAIIGVALAVYFEPSHCVRGWLHGEAFFEGRPTPWWREVVRSRFDPRPPHSWQKWIAWMPEVRRDDEARDLVGDVAADAVLLELADDDNARVSEFARFVLERSPRDREHMDRNWIVIRVQMNASENGVFEGRAEEN